MSTDTSEWTNTKKVDYPSDIFKNNGHNKPEITLPAKVEDNKFKGLRAYILKTITDNSVTLDLISTLTYFRTVLKRNPV